MPDRPSGKNCLEARYNFENEKDKATGNKFFGNVVEE